MTMFVYVIIYYRIKHFIMIISKEKKVFIMIVSV